MFKKILDKVFNKAPPDPLPDEILAKAIEEQCLKNDLEPTPHFLSKVLIQQCSTYFDTLHHSFCCFGILLGFFKNTI